ncbi:MAG TPA: Ig-like domain-containing protein, partial [Candidatus Krumholzibacteria bacterium]|nr:Ig-like domain-containing protein [Candidatus Krumholzibacteria bacterium]
NTNLVTILTGAPNVAPVAVADTVQLVDDQPVLIDVLANDSDSDGVLVPASVAVVILPLHGTADVDTLTGGILYTPDAGYVGADSLAYTVEDDFGYASNPAVVTIAVPDVVAPAAVAQLDATGGAGAVVLAWDGVPADADSLEVWRAVWRGGDGQSAYPLYDDAPGSLLPVRPADHAAILADSTWTLAALLPASATGYVDSLSVRGDWHYEIFARDAAGNTSLPTSVAPRALSYLLGDVADGGDAVVDSLDVAVLTAAFGTLRGGDGFDAALDIGPTADGTTAGVPLTDGAVDFEDAMIAAMNYGNPAAPAAAGGDVLLAWRQPAPGTWVLSLEQPHASLKGLRVVCALPDSVTAAVVAGALGDGQSAPLLVADADSLGIAVVALGGGAVIEGSGELLVLTLSGPADLTTAVVTARATDNTDLVVTYAQVSAVPGAPAAAFGLAQNSPNPFNPQTTIRFALDRGGRVRLAVFDVRGRLVAKLVDGDLPAGAHSVVWDGHDGRGAPVGSGVYLYRLESGGQAETRRMTLVK